MFACKSCGGALRYDIASGKMLCPYCDTSYDPYEIDQEGTAHETQEYDMQIYTCPQCGGELGSTETSAVEFCSYCGAPTVLKSRLERVKRPRYIIPFKKTREESKEALKKYLKKSFFISDDFKKAEVEKIRGIYMPCWNYNITQSGPSSMRYSIEKGRYTEVYQVMADVNNTFRGIPHDASEAFADRISEVLEPYNYKERQDFTPSYTAGFFSDIQDVDMEKYEKEAIEMANRYAAREFIANIDTEGGTVKEESSHALNNIFHTKSEEPDCTLVPVWFLSYRAKDRIAYAAVNGETGKVVSDMPIAINKIWAMALVLAIPLFFLMNLIVSMRAGTLLQLAIGMIVLVSVLCCVELERVSKRESEGAQWERAPRKANKSKRKHGIKRIPWATIGCLVAIIVPFWFVAVVLLALALGVAGGILYICMFIAAVAIPGIGLMAYKNEPVHGAYYGFIPLLIMGVVSVAIVLWDPVYDVIFYGTVIADLLAILYALSNVWKALNLLTTRPLPQFASRGGENHEM